MVCHDSDTHLQRYSGTSYNGPPPPHQRITSLLQMIAVPPIESTIVIVYKQPPTSCHSRFRTADKLYTPNCRSAIENDLL